MHLFEKIYYRSVNPEMMNNEIIHTAIWAGRMFVVAVIVLRVRLETVGNLQSRTNVNRHTYYSEPFRTK